MAQDLPEDKYDFKLQKDQRTFAENLLHVAAVDSPGNIRVSRLFPIITDGPKRRPLLGNHREMEFEEISLLRIATAAERLLGRQALLLTRHYP